MSNTKNILLAFIYFLLSTVLTGFFIIYKYWLYPSVNAMVISGLIAGAKWMLQLAAAGIWLGKEKWIFIKQLGLICLIGSCLLYTYNLMSYLPIPFSSFTQFIVAIAIAVITMTFLYYWAVKRVRLPLKWFIGWIICLVIAIVLQITIVFYGQLFLN
jgi:hypothetical protein